MYITEEHIADYHRDGYLLVPDVFTPTEIRAMIADVEGGDSRIASHTRGNEDSTGRKAKLAIWHELGDDIWAAASTHPRIVNGVRMAMGEDVAFFHGKVMLKEAGTGGAWEWHQDYGYWYNQGFAFPRMLSVFVAMDAATKGKRLPASVAWIAQIRPTRSWQSRSADRGRPRPHRADRSAF